MLTCFHLVVFDALKLLAQVNRKAAVFMVVLVLISIPISFGTLISQINVLSYINEGTFATQMTRTKVQTIIMAQLEQISNGTLMTQIFWGLWLLSFGFLVYKSGFIPKILGALLFIGCFG